MAGNGLLAVAHRAGNSLAGLHGAVRLGADVIEADVHHYRGRLEVRHLKTMGPLPWLWDRWELRSGSAPRLGLGELLTAADRGITFMLDLKGRHVTGGDAVVRALHEYAPGRPVLVCSRYWPALTPFRQLPWVRTVRSARTRAELSVLLRRLDRTADPGHGASVHRSLLTPALMARLHERLDVVMTWPVDDLATLEAVAPLRRTGTLGVISNQDTVLRHVLALAD
jgi:glycerophosphoryl diester phosphodiesterase